LLKALVAFIVAVLASATMASTEEQHETPEQTPEAPDEKKDAAAPAEGSTEDPGNAPGVWEGYAPCGSQDGTGGQQMQWPGQSQAMCYQVGDMQCPITYAIDPYTQQLFMGAMVVPAKTDEAEVPKDDVQVPTEWEQVFTVMMRNLPNRYTQLMLLQDIASSGFRGTFDFLYLPIDPETNANKGYAFINFVDPTHAWRFKGLYDGQRMKFFNSRKSVLVSPADLQGLEANYAHYSSVRCSRGNPSWRPLFFREPQQKFVPRNGAPAKCNGRKQRGKSLVDVAVQRNELLKSEQQVPTEEEERMRKFCPFCGTPTQPSYRFCQNCGGNLQDLDEEEEAAPAPA